MQTWWTEDHCNAAWKPFAKNKLKEIKKSNKNPFTIAKYTMLTWLARSWYFCFSSGPRAYHHSPRILDTVRLSWLGWRWWTRGRWRLLKIINAFIGRLMWSLSFAYWRRRNNKLRMRLQNITSDDRNRVTVSFKSTRA